jgi:hypothetical protein
MSHLSCSPGGLDATPEVRTVEKTIIDPWIASSSIEAACEEICALAFYHLGDHAMSVYRTIWKETFAVLLTT